MKEDLHRTLPAAELDRNLREITARLRLKGDVQNAIVKLKAMLLRAELHVVQNQKQALNYAQLNAEEIVREMVKGGFSASELPSVAQLKETLARGTQVQLLREVTEKSCKGADLERPRLPSCVRAELKPAEHANSCNIPKNASAVASVWAKSYALKLSRAFDLPNPQPFTADMCANVIQDPGFDAHYSVTGDTDLCNERHAVLVLGRRLNPHNGRLEFLVRDSRFPPCPSQWIAKQWECAGPATFWIGAEALVRNTWSVEGMDLPPL